MVVGRGGGLVGYVFVVANMHSDRASRDGNKPVETSREKVLCVCVFVHWGVK